MRHLIASFMLAALSGCQMAGPAPTPAPTSIEQRLAAIESRRMQFPPPAAQRPAVANRSVAINVTNEQILNLSDMDPPADSMRTDESSNSETAVTSLTSSEKEEKYLRRSPLPSLWDTIKRDAKNAPHDLWHDTKRVYANPVNLVILGTAYGGSLALQHGVDNSIEHHFNYNDDFQAPHHTFGNDWREAFAAVGSPYTHFAMAGAWYLIGQQRMDDKTYEVGKTLFSALTINGVTVVLGQAASCDKAPNGEYGTFPSGHTSSSFVVASVLHEAYGHAVGIPLYALAALAGYERLDDREHYFSDVMMGGVMGLVIGHSVASGRDPEFFGWKVLPYVSTQGGSGVAFLKTFE
jgi:hypothetical protein